ncbi:MAG: hypothetical protein GF315_00535, partial [candidate division Zixibacteria bacterium]|nr:hypothetical protein [candidate division Zixibacteria bacterium]
MKKLIYLIMIITLYHLIPTNPCYSQDTLWTRTYGGPNWDDPSDILIIDDGGYMIAGDNDVYDGYIVRTDSLGNNIWTSTFGGNGFQALTGICRHDNDFFLSGGSGVDFFSPTDGWLVCISNNGDSLWSKTYGGEDDDGFTSMAATGDGGYILAGFTHSYGQGDDDWYLVKTDSLGDTIWTRTYGSPHFDACYALQETSDGGYIMGGMCANGAYIVKTDAQGELTWDDRDDGLTYTMYKEVKQTDDGGYIAVGIAHADGGEQL